MFYIGLYRKNIRKNLLVWNHVAWPSKPLHSLFKLCPCGHSWPHPKCPQGHGQLSTDTFMYALNKTPVSFLGRLGPLFFEHGYVVYHIKWNQECNKHGSKYFARRPLSATPTLGVGSICQNSPFSQHSHVAYGIVGNHECSNMVANILPAASNLCIVCARKILKNPPVSLGTLRLKSRACVNMRCALPKITTLKK